MFNPFVKLRINNLDDIFEQLEYVQNQRKANAEVCLTFLTLHFQSSYFLFKTPNHMNFINFIMYIPCQIIFTYFFFRNIILSIFSILQSSSLMTVSDGQINDELSKIRASQIKRNAKRDQQLAALNDAIASAKEAKRQERIKAKKEAARNLRSQDSVVEEDYEEEPEVVPVRS